MSNYVSVQTVAAAAYAYYTWDVNGAWGLLYAGASAYGDYRRGNTQIQGPDAADLSIPTSQYGTPIGWGFGGLRMAPQVWWASEKRANVSTTGGKGSGPEPEVTTVTREMDLLLGLGEFQAKQISRVFMNGKVVWTRREGASEASLAASTGSDLWRRMTFYDGNPNQLPDPDYEAAVGAGNAPAYRGRSTLFLKGLQLGQSGIIPAISVEVAISGSYTIGAVSDGPARSSPGFLTGTPAAVGSSVMRVAIGQFDSFFANSTVWLVDFDMLAGTTNVWGSYEVQEGSNERGTVGTSNRPVLVTGSISYARVYESGGLYSLINTTVDRAQGSMRWALNDNDMVVGSADFNAFNTRRLFRYDIVASSNAVQQSAPLASPVHSIVIIGTQVYAVENRASPDGVPNAFYRLDLATLTLQETIVGPEGGDTRPLLFALEGDLGYISGLTRTVYARRNGAWLNLGALPAGYGQGNGSNWSACVVGGLLTGCKLDAHPGGSVITWKAPLKVEPTGATVADVVDEVCRRAGMPAGSWDTTALASITRPVRSLGIGQVMPGRAVLEQLTQAFFFEPVLRDKLYFRPRGGAPVTTISWRELGAAVDQADPQPFSPVQNGELELPPVIAAQYVNVQDDSQAGLEKADRMVAGQAATQVLRWAIGMTPGEAKAAVDALVVDSLAALLRAPLALPITYAQLEAGDVVNVTSRAGRTYRLRLVRMRQQRGVLGFETVGDDASALLSAGVTDATQAISNEVAAYADTLLLVLDVPLLRDVDDVPGVYVAARGVASPWPGCAVVYSTDGISFDRTAAEVDESAIIGIASTALAAYTGAGFDEVNAVTVDVGAGELETVTRAALLADPTLNTLLVGNEVLRYMRAQQVSAGVYTLTGLLRARRGTEWAMAGHVVGERVVALRTRGLRRVEQQQPELGRVRTVKGVTRGATVDDAAAVNFTNTGASQKPLAPVALRGVMTTAGLRLQWKRRTRLQATFGGAGGSYRPLGEDAQAYDVELRDGTNELVQSARVSTPEWLVPGGAVLVTWERGMVAPHANGASVWGLEAATYAGGPSVQRLVQHSAAGVLEGQSFDVGNGPLAASYSGSTAWVAAHWLARPPGATFDVYQSSTLYRVDLASLGAPAASWQPGTSGQLAGVVYDGTHVWTTAPTTTNNLRRHNATTLAVLNTYTIGEEPNQLQAGGGKLYVTLGSTNSLPARVQRVDAVTGAVDWTADIGVTGGDRLQLVGSLVFAATFNGVVVLNASTGAVVAQYTDGAPAGFAGLAVVDGDVIYRPVTVNAGQRPYRVLEGSTGAVLAEVPLPDVAEVTGAVGAAAFGVSQNLAVGYTLSLLPNLSGYTATVWQVSAAVGRGYAASLTL